MMIDAMLKRLKGRGSISVVCIVLFVSFCLMSCRGNQSFRSEHPDPNTNNTPVGNQNGSCQAHGWIQHTSIPLWSMREGHTTLVFDDKLWLMGGGGRRGSNDVWASQDGVEWELVVEHAPWPRREKHTSVVFDGKMWVIGGWCWGENRKPSALADVWCSEDGRNWVEVCHAAPWKARGDHVSVAFDGRIWVMAGLTTAPPLAQADGCLVLG